MEPTLPAALLLALAVISAATGSAAGSSRDADFDALVEDFLPKYWQAFPSEASAAGVHTYDTELEDYSAAGIAVKLALFRNTLARAKAIPVRSLSSEKQIDRDILIKTLEWGLLDLDQLRTWSKNPGLYNDVASYSLFLLFMRRSAPPEVRARAVVARLQRVPPLFAAARANLTGQTPALAVETAIRDTKGTVAFLEKSAREFVTKSAAGDGKLAADAEPAIRSAVAAAQEYIRFLEKDLAPRAKGSYAIGRKMYRLKSAYLQDVELSPDAIASRGLAEVRRLQGEMKKAAAELAPGKSLPEALDLAAADHPSAAELIPAYRSRQQELRNFILQHHVVTMPPKDELEILETPEFARSMISAAVFPAGAFETADLTTYYIVTPIDLSRPHSDQEAQLGEHSVSSTDITSIHEAYPGHHVQLSKARPYPSKVRKWVGNGVFIEGWAHYCEQMMVEQGYQAGPKLRLFMLKDALLRAARMHLDPLVSTGQTSYEDAKNFFAKEAYQSAVTAEMEARRVALNPATVYIYTVGKLWIQEIEVKEKQRLGADFKLGDFHDRLLSHGSTPLPLMARYYFHTTLSAR